MQGFSLILLFSFASTFSLSFSLHSCSLSFPSSLILPSDSLPSSSRADSISLDKIKQWSDLAYFHHSKMKGIFEDLAGMKISDFSKPVMNEGDYKVFSYEESDDEQKALYDARTTLIDFQEDLRENFEKMFGVLVSFFFLSPFLSFLSLPSSSLQPFLPLPWDEYTLFQVFHYKWLLVSFTSPAELRHLGALASAYEESCKNVYRAERERSKRKSILSRGLLGRFGLFFIFLPPPSFLTNRCYH